MADRKLGTLSISLLSDVEALLKGLDAAVVKIGEFQREINTAKAGLAGVTASPAGSASGTKKIADDLQGAARYARSLAKGLQGLAEPANKAVAAYRGVATAASRLDKVLGGLNKTITAQLAGLKQLGAIQATVNAAVQQAQGYATQAAGATAKVGTAMQQVATGATAARQALKGKSGGTSGGSGSFLADLFGDMRSIIFLQARFLAGFQAIAAVTSSIGFAVRGAIDFNTRLAEIRAVANPTTVELQRLAKAALEVGSTTAVSAVEAAKALVLLSQAGFTAGESQSALKAAVALSVGGFASLDDSVKLLTTTIRAFGLTAGDSNDIANTLAATVNASKSSVQDLNIALNFVATTASESGLTLAQTAATLGVLADNGVRASTQGTALRQALAALSSPTEKALKIFTQLGLSLSEINPLTNDYIDVLKRLRTAGFGVQEATDAFGRRTGSALVNLIRNAEAVERMTNVIQGSNAAFEAQARAQESVSGQAAILANKFQVLAITFGEQMAPAAISVLQALQGLVDVLQRFSAELQALAVVGFTAGLFKLAEATGLAQKAAAALLATLRGFVLFAGFTAGITRAAGALAGMSFAIRSIGTALLTLITPMRVFLVAVGALTYLYQQTTAAQAAYNDQIRAGGEANREQLKTVFQLIQNYQGIEKSLETLKEGTASYAIAQSDLRRSTIQLVQQFPSLIDQIDETTGTLQKGLGDSLKDAVIGQADIQIAALQRLRAEQEKLTTSFTGQVVVAARERIRVIDEEIAKQQQQKQSFIDVTTAYTDRLAEVQGQLETAFREKDTKSVIAILNDEFERVTDTIKTVFSPQADAIITKLTSMRGAVEDGAKGFEDVKREVSEMGEGFKEVAESPVFEQLITFFIQVQSRVRGLSDDFAQLQFRIKDLLTESSKAYDDAVEDFLASQANLDATRAGGSPEAGREAEATTRLKQQLVTQTRLLQHQLKENIGVELEFNEAYKAVSEQRVTTLGDEIRTKIKLNATYDAALTDILLAGQQRIEALEFRSQETRNRAAISGANKRNNASESSFESLYKIQAEAQAKSLESAGKYVDAVIVKYKNLRDELGAAAKPGEFDNRLKALNAKEAIELIDAAEKENQATRAESAKLLDERLNALEIEKDLQLKLLDLEQERLDAGVLSTGRAETEAAIAHKRIDIEIQDNERRQALAQEEIARAREVADLSDQRQQQAAETIAAQVELLHGTKEQAAAARAVIDVEKANLSVSAAQQAEAKETVVQQEQNLQTLRNQNTVLTEQKKLVREAGEVIVDVGTLIKDLIADSLEAAILRTGRLADAFKSLKVSVIKNMTQAFAQSLTEKLGFDKVFKANFLGLGIFSGKSIFDGIKGGIGKGASLVQSALTAIVGDSSGSIESFFSGITGNAVGNENSPDFVGPRADGSIPAPSNLTGSAGALGSLVAVAGALFTIAKTTQAVLESAKKLEKTTEGSSEAKDFRTGALIELGVGIAIGAAVGAAVGSIFPVIGTVIGAAVGGTIGGLTAKAITDAVSGAIGSAVGQGKREGLSNEELYKQVHSDGKFRIAQAVASPGYGTYEAILGRPFEPFGANNKDANALFATGADPLLFTLNKLFEMISKIPDIEVIFDKLFTRIASATGLNFNRQLGDANEGLRKGGKELVESYSKYSEDLEFVSKYIAGIVGAGAENAARLLRFQNIIKNSLAQQGVESEEFLEILDKLIRAASGNNLTRALNQLQKSFDFHPDKQSILLTKEMAGALDRLARAFQPFIGDKLNVREFLQTLAEGDFVRSPTDLKKSRKLVNKAGADLFEGPDFERNFESFIGKLKDGLKGAFISAITSAFVTPVLGSIVAPLFGVLRKFVRAALKGGGDDGLAELKERFEKRLEKAGGKVRDALLQAKPFLEDLFEFAVEFQESLDAVAQTPIEEFERRMQGIKAIMGSIESLILRSNEFVQQALATQTRLVGKIFQATGLLVEVTENGIEIKGPGATPGEAFASLLGAAGNRAFLDRTPGLSPEARLGVLGNIESQIDQFFSLAVSAITEQFAPLVKTAGAFKQIAESVTTLIRNLRVGEPAVTPDRERRGILQREIQAQQAIFRTGTDEERVDSANKLVDLFQEYMGVAKETLDNTGPEFQAAFRFVIDGLDEVRSVTKEGGDELVSIAAQMQEKISEAAAQAKEYYEYVEAETLRAIQEQADLDAQRLQAIRDLILGPGSTGSLTDVLTALQGMTPDQLTELASKINIIAEAFPSAQEIANAIAIGQGRQPPFPTDGGGGGGGATPNELPDKAGKERVQRARGALGDTDLSAEQLRTVLTNTIRTSFHGGSEVVQFENGVEGPLDKYQGYVKKLLLAYLNSLNLPAEITFKEAALALEFFSIKLAEIQDALGEQIFLPQKGLRDFRSQFADRFFAYLGQTKAAKGMIVNVGEAGDSESIIPLNRQGADFFVSAIGRIVNQSSALRADLASRAFGARPSVSSLGSFSGGGPDQITLNVMPDAIRMEIDATSPSTVQTLPKATIDALKREIKYGSLGAVVKERAAS